MVRTLFLILGISLLGAQSALADANFQNQEGFLERACFALTKDPNATEKPYGYVPFQSYSVLREASRPEPPDFSPLQAVNAFEVMCVRNSVIPSIYDFKVLRAGYALHLIGPTKARVKLSLAPGNQVLWSVETGEVKGKELEVLQTRITQLSMILNGEVEPIYDLDRD